MSEAYDLGFLGGGQLARMSIQAAQRMGLSCLSLDPSADSPASQIAPSIVGALDDTEKIGRLAKSCRRVTLENEFIPASSIQEAFESTGLPEHRLMPGIQTLATIQDKLSQRMALVRAGVPSPKAIALTGDGGDAVRQIGFPMVIKARFGGYDGKGTRYARTSGELDSFRPVWGSGGWLAESYVPFRRELAVMVYAGNFGVGAFPTMETVQVDSVCDLVFPSGTDASKTAIAAVEAVGGRGLFGVELFELENGSILINELAPRPHNTGHYTLDWGGASQFEQHVRLAMGWAPGTSVGQDACMANLLGQGETDDFRRGIAAALERQRDVHFHWYGKSASRKGRKMGHITAVGTDCLARARIARDAFYAAV